MVQETFFQDIGYIDAYFYSVFGLVSTYHIMGSNDGMRSFAEWLEANPKVKWVNYCGLKSSKYYDLAQKYMPNGSCGVIAFGLKGSREDAIKFMDELKLACIVTHVADARTACFIRQVILTAS